VLELLAKKDKYWREIAFKICKDKYLADDLVNDMYLQLAENKTYDSTKGDWYIIIVIRNLFINHTKQRVEFSIDDVIIKETQNYFEIDDNELELIKGLKWWERELLELSYDHSLRDLGEKLNINYAFIYRTIKRIRNGEKK
jgi:DNA-directed RNA polymerase specialized sigma24 family protein